MMYSIYTSKDRITWKLIYDNVDIAVLTGYIARTNKLRTHYNTSLKIITN
jgi:hypothetical protein